MEKCDLLIYSPFEVNKVWEMLEILIGVKYRYIIPKESLFIDYND